MSKVLIVDDSDPAIIYQGGWSSTGVMGTTTNEYNSTLHRSSGFPGDELSYTFYGTDVSLYGTLDLPGFHGNPNATFSIDGSTPTAFNASRNVFVEALNTITSHVLMYKSPTLQKGSHTITVKTGTPASSAARLYVDFLTVSTGSDTASGDIIVDDRDPSIVTSGSWDVAGSAVEYNSTTRQASAGSTAAFKFNGTSITVYGTTVASTTPYTKAGIGFSLDGVNSTFEGPQVAPVTRHIPFFHADGLSNQEHTIVVSTVLPMLWYLDYMVYTAATGVAVGNSSSVPVPNNGANSKLDIGRIAGGVIGGVMGLLTLTIIIIVLLKRQVKGERDEEKVAIKARPPVGHDAYDTGRYPPGPRKYDRLSSQVSALPSMPSPANPEPPTSAPLVFRDEYNSSHRGWSQNATGSHAGQQEEYPSLRPLPTVPVQAQSREHIAHPYNPTVYQQFDYRDQGSSSASYSPSTTTSPNDRVTLRSTSDKSTFTPHGRSLSNASQSAVPPVPALAPLTIYPTIEEDSGIRIPRTNPPLYTAD